MRSTLRRWIRAIDEDEVARQHMAARAPSPPVELVDDSQLDTQQTSAGAQMQVTQGGNDFDETETGPGSKNVQGNFAAQGDINIG